MSLDNTHPLIPYLAGLFDGEGSFSIQVGLRESRGRRPAAHFNPSMSVNLYYGTEVLDLFVEHLGGTIYPYAKGGRRWHLGRRVDVTAAAELLLPHLIVKRQIAERFLEALSLFPSMEGRQRKGYERVWTPELSVRVAEMALTLNPARARRSNKTAEYLEVMMRELTLASDNDYKRATLSLAGEGTPAEGESHDHRDARPTSEGG